jgi:hypothetical protein
MSDAKKPFSVWMMPAAVDAQRLSATITALSREQGVPNFAPHLTLYVGMTATLDDVQKALQEACQGVPPMSLPVRGTAYSEDFFKTYFLTLAPDPALTALHADLRRRLGGVYLLEPHVSLLYKELTAVERQALATRHPARLAQVAFDAVHLVTTDDPGGWRAVTAWRTVCAVPLTGRGS